MFSELHSALAGVVERLTVLAETDAELREQLQALARAFLSATERPAATVDPIAAPAATPLVEPVAPEPLPRLELAGAGTQAVEPAPAPQWIPGPVLRRDDAAPIPPPVQEVADADLPLIEDRLRLKAEGSRWAAARRRRLTDGADFRIEVEPLDRELIERARKLPDCFLWMNHPNGPSPSDLALLDDLAGCFDTAADAVALVRGILNDSTDNRAALEQALDLLAEAQSALRAAALQIGAGQDKDQLRAYLWLRGTGWNLQYFIGRYMKIEDAADPASWPAIDRRIEGLDAQLQQVRQRGKRSQSALKRIRYHLKPIAEGQAGDRQHDWQIIIDTVEQLVQDGVPPSNADLRELLLPVFDRLPDLELSPGFARVLREIDRFAATRPTAPDAPAAPAPTPEVQAVARLLAGKTVVLIGGERRADAHRAIKESFALKELDWVETREHESTSTFEAHVARPDVALVLLAIRWSSHSFGDVKNDCDRYGKPLVRLPAGYNPNQVAAQVLAQSSGRLAET